MLEKWREVKDYEGLYQISDQGRVKSFYNGRYTILKVGKFLKPQKNVRGYLQIGFYKNNKFKTYQIHNLIAAAFLNKSDLSELEVNHKNGIKTDNRLKNLELVTHSENIKHAIKFGLFKPFLTYARKEGLYKPKIKGKQMFNQIEITA